MQAEDGTLPGKDEEKVAVLQRRSLFEMHRYYSFLQEDTFQTSFVDISIDQARAWRKQS